MAHITALPVELIDHIVSFIPSTKQRSLSNLSLSCRPLYNSVTPALYRRLHIYFSGRASWESRTNALKELAPPGSYTVPRADGEPPVNRKGQSVAEPHGNGCPSSTIVERKLPTYFIREIEVDGYWSTPMEQMGSNFPRDESVERVHGPFLKALLGVLCSIDRLDSFTWNVITPISPEVTLALARFDSLKTLKVVCDTHMVDGPVHYSYAASAPSIPTMDPSPLYYNSLHTLKALQLGDHNHAVQFGDLIRSPTNWKSLRHLEVDLSPGFINSLIEIEPLEPDILFALFRPPVAPRGSLKPAKLTLDSIKMKDVSFQASGIDAIVAAVDPAVLKSIVLCYCQEGGSLLKRWEKNALHSLERIVLKDELTFPALTKFLKQFGPEGECRKLKSLHLTCATLPSDNTFDPGYPDFYNQYYYPYDTDTDMSDFDGDGDDDYIPETHYAPGPPALNAVVASPKDSVPQPWRRIRDLRGSREEGWGLERLFLDMSSSMSSFSHTPLIPKQDIFYEGFWKLRELACPVSYEPSLWTPFVETVSKLPNLTHLCLLNHRPEPRLPGAYLSAFHPNYTHHHMPPPLSNAFIINGARPGGRNATRGRRKKSAKEEEPDKGYVDALAIAAGNRLYVHSNGISGADALASLATTPSASSAAPSQAPPMMDSWHGKLTHIGIRPPHTFGGKSTARTWRVVVQKQKPPKKPLKPEPETERKKSLRSSTKKRKVEETKKNWRVATEGESECKLVELARMEVEELGISVFGGRESTWR